MPCLQSQTLRPLMDIGFFRHCCAAVRRIATVISGLVVSAGCAAAQSERGAPAKPETVADPLGPGGLFQMFGGLILVLAIIIGLAWAVRRFGRFGPQGGGALRIVGGLSMGARERVVLLQAGETQILVGVAPGRVQTLHVLDKPVEPGSQPPGEQVFADRLKQVLSREGSSK